jgi:pyruvate, orthophosphate dikinase
MYQASDGVLTCKGGLTSHAAIVMRNMGKSAVVGAKNISIDFEKGLINCKDGKIKIKRGEIITIDGSTGFVYNGAVPTIPAGEDEDFRTILRWADKYKRLKVLANAETIEDAKVVD